MDFVLTCKDCGATFVFSKGEVDYYLKSNMSPPKRCKKCREKNEIKELQLKASSYFSNAQVYGPGTSVAGGLSTEYRYYLKTEDDGFFKAVESGFKITNDYTEKTMFNEKAEAEKYSADLKAKYGLETRIVSVSTYIIIRK